MSDRSTHEKPVHEKPVLYVSFDVECDSGYSGPSLANMWELGAVFLLSDGTEVDSFSSLIRCRAGRLGHPKTKQWLKEAGLWDKYLLCSDTSETAPLPPTVMRAFGLLLQQWAETHSLKFVASPGAYDFMWLKDYYSLYAPEELQSLVGYTCTCLSSMLTLYEAGTGQTTPAARKLLWDSLTKGHLHTHCALDDAREQGAAFINLMKRMPFTQ